MKVLTVEFISLRHYVISKLEFSFAQPDTVLALGSRVDAGVCRCMSVCVCVLSSLLNAELKNERKFFFCEYQT